MMQVGAQAQVPDDDPRMIAWEAFKKTDEFANIVRWNGQHAIGSAWAAFIAGWTAARSDKDPSP